MTLSSREKSLATAAAVGVVLLLAYQFGLRPAIERTRTLKRTIPQKQEQLSEVRQLADEYMRLEDEIENLTREIPQPEAGFSPLSFIEKALDEAGIAEWSLSRSREDREERIVQVAIDVRIDETGWRELIDFFRSIDTAEPSLRLSRLEIRHQTQRGRRQGLRADVTVTGLRSPD